jgi:hypothetical protein
MEKKGSIIHSLSIIDDDEVSTVTQSQVAARNFDRRQNRARLSPRVACVPGVLGQLDVRPFGARWCP